MKLTRAFEFTRVQTLRKESGWCPPPPPISDPTSIRKDNIIGRTYPPLRYTLASGVLKLDLL